MDNQSKLIESVIRTNYITAIHRNQDKSLAEQGFHKKFRMYVKKNEEINSISLDNWFEQISGIKESSPETLKADTTIDIQTIDVYNDCAYVKISLFKDEKYFGTDLILLYFIESRWQIISKIYTTASESLLN